MENASKALLIAGGILLGMLTLGLLATMFNNISTMQNAKADKKITEEIAAWNSEWEAYNKSYLYGTEVLTVINKAQQNNYEDNLYKVKIEVINTDGSGKVELIGTTFSYRGKY